MLFVSVASAVRDSRSAYWLGNKKKHANNVYIEIIFVYVNVSSFFSIINSAFFATLYVMDMWWNTLWKVDPDCRKMIIKAINCLITLSNWPFLKDPLISITLKKNHACATTSSCPVLSSLTAGQQLQPTMYPDMDCGSSTHPFWRWGAHLQHYQELQTAPRVTAECPWTSRDSHPEEVSHWVTLFWCVTVVLFLAIAQ